MAERDFLSNEHTDEHNVEIPFQKENGPYTIGSHLYFEENGEERSVISLYENGKLIERQNMHTEDNLAYEAFIGNVSDHLKSAYPEAFDEEKYLTCENEYSREVNADHLMKYADQYVKDVEQLYEDQTFAIDVRDDLIRKAEAAKELLKNVDKDELFEVRCSINDTHKMFDIDGYTNSYDNYQGIMTQLEDRQQIHIDYEKLPRNQIGLVESEGELSPQEIRHIILSDPIKAEQYKLADCIQAEVSPQKHTKEITVATAYAQVSEKYRDLSIMYQKLTIEKCELRVKLDESKKLHMRCDRYNAKSKALAKAKLQHEKQEVFISHGKPKFWQLGLKRAYNTAKEAWEREGKHLELIERDLIQENVEILSQKKLTKNVWELEGNKIDLQDKISKCNDLSSYYAQLKEKLAKVQKAGLGNEKITLQTEIGNTLLYKPTEYMHGSKTYKYEQTHNDRAFRALKVQMSKLEKKAQEMTATLNMGKKATRISR